MTTFSIQLNKTLPNYAALIQELRLIQDELSEYPPLDELYGMLYLDLSDALAQFCLENTPNHLVTDIIVKRLNLPDSPLSLDAAILQLKAWDGSDEDISTDLIDYLRLDTLPDPNFIGERFSGTRFVARHILCVKALRKKKAFIETQIASLDDHFSHVSKLPVITIGMILAFSMMFLIFFLFLAQY